MHLRCRYAPEMQVRTCTKIHLVPRFISYRDSSRLLCRRLVQCILSLSSPPSLHSLYDHIWLCRRLVQCILSLSSPQSLHSLYDHIWLFRRLVQCILSLSSPQCLHSLYNHIWLCRRLVQCILSLSSPEVFILRYAPEV